MNQHQARPEQARTVLRGRAVMAPGILEDAAVVVAGTELAYAGPAAGYAPAPADEVVNLAPDQLLVPGLVDLHCHGGYGVDFSGADAEEARGGIASIHAAGTTTLLASVVTSPPETLHRQLGMLAGLADEGLLAGMHLEGPFLSEVRCGAQDPRWLLAPDEELAAALIGSGRGFLRTMTYAPELPGADGLVRLLARRGVVPSLGHTAAAPERAAESLALAGQELAGAGGPASAARPTVTHLFNGMDPLHHRSPGAISACLRAARAGTAAVELIADNVHLDPQLVAAMFELLGAQNILLVTDAMAAAGLDDGDYRLGPADVTVREGTARVAATGAIAGGTAGMLDLVRNAVGAGVGLADAVAAATAVPARVLGREKEIGSLVAGGRADVLVLGPGLELQRVMRQGRWLDPAFAPRPAHLR